MAKLAALACALAAAGAAAEFMTADDPRVRWTGRPVFNGDGSVSFDWIHTSASFAVVGTGSVTLHANITLGLVGRAQVTMGDYDAQNLLLAQGTDTYLLAAGLVANETQISVHYGLEAGMSGAGQPAGRVVTFLGFETSGTATFAAGTQLVRRIDVIGDSITAGPSGARARAGAG